MASTDSDSVTLLELYRKFYGVEPKRSKTKGICPVCGKEAELNFDDNVWNCFHCGRSGYPGGVLGFYAAYRNVPMVNAAKAMLKEFRDGIKPETVLKPLEVPPTIEADLASTENRDKTYRNLLLGLSLASDHLENLLNRGLSEKTIEENMYRTTPVYGGRKIAQQLLDKGCTLEGVPGFYVDSSGKWTLNISNRGIMIPVLDSRKRIQGLQVRLDNVERGKYRWLSSTDRTLGCKAQVWVHLRGDPTVETIIITEGPLKADVIHELHGDTVLAVPGVSSLLHLKDALLSLKARNLKSVRCAFDMDIIEKPQVQNCLKNLIDIVKSVGLTGTVLKWNRAYKGLDDYLLAKKQGKIGRITFDEGGDSSA